MFVRYWVNVGQPVERVEKVLQNGPEGWIPGLVEETNGCLQTELGLEAGNYWVSREVTIKVGSPYQVSAGTLLPIAWEDALNPGLFPILDGQLEARRHSAARTQIALSATYTPPGGFLGEIADRLLLHRVAEAIVKDFVERVGRLVEQRATVTHRDSLP